MKQGLKRFFSAVSPNLFELVQTIRARRHIARLMKDWGLDRIDREFLVAHEPIVRHGPFRRMKLVTATSSANLLPHVLGSYESELHPLIERISRRGYEVIADVGCAEGYYAVGLARLLPGAHVLAYDLDPYARKLCRQNAALNGVEQRVTVLRRCSPACLQAALRCRSLVVCDCEGYEFELLSPDRAPALSSADILVELHAPPESQQVKTLIARFERTHEIDRAEPVPRNPAQYPELNVLAEQDRLAGIQEIRVPGQSWLFLSPRR